MWNHTRTLLIFDNMCSEESVSYISKPFTPHIEIHERLLSVSRYRYIQIGYPEINTPERKTVLKRAFIFVSYYSQIIGRM